MTLDVLILLAGLVVLVAGAEALVRGSSRLAAALGVTPLVIGLTLVAYGTSAPEMAVSARAALSDRSTIALGNVIGSNIFNLLAILGLSALVKPLVVHRTLVRRDVPVMIAVSAATYLMALDGRMSRVDGLILVLGAVAYTWSTVRTARRHPEDAPPVALPDATGRGFAARQVLLALAGLALLVLGSRWLVDGATAIARALSVSELVIGLTIVAAGTSLPELATSVLATMRGQRDIAVGNVVGSNIFNLVGILGVAALLAPGGLEVPRSSLRFDLPLAVAAAFACLPVFISGLQISRIEGLLFFASYVGYLVMLARESRGVPVALLGWAMLAVLVVAPTIHAVAGRRRSARTTGG
jgi:cation:H+ antiporter